MSQVPRVVAVTAGSPAETAGVRVGDEVLTVDGERPRDIIRWNWLIDEPQIDLDIRRGGLEVEIRVDKAAGEPLGIEVHSALFDQLRTCDNHCEFCFIYQLPPGMRKSLYLKDDDYRLSFLYGNFTTLTRFTELDYERVVTEGLSPLNVSIHATSHAVRNEMLRNRRGGPTLRWLRALLDHGIEIHGQIVCCPGLNDGEVLEETLAGVLDRFPELASLCVVPLGISRFNTEERLRPTTRDEARAVVRIVAEWQDIYLELFGRRLVFAADEYYLLADLPFPEPETYEGFAMHEDGIGMARTFELEFSGRTETVTTPQAGFFAWVDGAPAGSRYEAAADLSAPPEGYRDIRTTTPPAPTGCGPTVADGGEVAVSMRPRRDAAITILTGEAGLPVLRPLVDSLGRDDVELCAVRNDYFGGTTSVTGLLVGEDIARTLDELPRNRRYLLPDVCLSRDQFLDGLTVSDLPRVVEIVSTDGGALRRALDPIR